MACAEGLDLIQGLSLIGVRTSTEFTKKKGPGPELSGAQGNLGTGNFELLYSTGPYNKPLLYSRDIAVLINIVTVLTLIMNTKEYTLSFASRHWLTSCLGYETIVHTSNSG